MEGIIVNGNTRMACFREQDLFAQIKVYIVDKTYTDQWARLRELVDSQDNKRPIKAEYPWYARALRLHKNVESYANDKNNITNEEVDDAIKKIYKRQQYSSQKEAKAFYCMLDYADEMIKFADDESIKDAKYTKRTDMGEDGTNSKSVQQALKTLHQNILKAKKDGHDNAVIEKIKQVIFKHIQTDYLGEGSFKFKDFHRLVSEYLSPEILENVHINVSDKFGGKDLPQSKNTILIDDKYELSKIAEQVKRRTEINAEASKSDRYKAVMKRVQEQVDAGDLCLNETSNLVGITEMIDKIIQSLETQKKQVQEYEDSK